MTLTEMATCMESGAAIPSQTDTFAESRAFTDRSNCRRAMAVFAGAHMLSPDEFRVSKKGPKDYRYQRVAATPTAQEADMPRKTNATSTHKTTTTKLTQKSHSRRNKTPRKSNIRPGTKLEIVKGLLMRTAGCTLADILAATGWPSVSVPQQARAAGLTLRKEKDGSVTRYFGK